MDSLLLRPFLAFHSKLVEWYDPAPQSIVQCNRVLAHTLRVLSRDSAQRDASMAYVLLIDVVDANPVGCNELQLRSMIYHLTGQGCTREHHNRGILELLRSGRRRVVPDDCNIRVEIEFWRLDPGVERYDMVFQWHFSAWALVLRVSCLERVEKMSLVDCQGWEMLYLHRAATPYFYKTEK